MKIFALLHSLLLMSALVVVSSCSREASSTKESKPSESRPLKVVRFGNLPYADHLFSIIGVSNGWFKEVGIDCRVTTVKVEDVVSGLANGSLDVVSVPPGMLFSAYNTTTNLCSFVFSDLFQGYALMAHPNAGFKGYKDFISQGMTHAKAVAATANQLKGKTFAYPSETAVKPFIDRLLEIGGLTRADFKNLVLDDPLTINAMRNRQADFQVGGAPSRITLQKEGFVPLVSSIDLAKAAAPTPQSKDLASILQNGWAVTKEFYQREFPTVLRLAAVNYRIMAYMRSNREDALRIHMAYLSQVTGQSFSAQDGMVIYDTLNPFWTFEEQKEWFHNTQNPLFYENVNGAILQSFINENLFKDTPPTVEDVIYADDTYRELERMKASASELFAKQDKTSLTLQQKAKLAAARKQFTNYNYFDAERLARQAFAETVQ